MNNVVINEIRLYSISYLLYKFGVENHTRFRDVSIRKVLNLVAPNLVLYFCPSIYQYTKWSSYLLRLLSGEYKLLITIVRLYHRGRTNLLSRKERS